MFRRLRLKALKGNLKFLTGKQDPMFTSHDYHAHSVYFLLTMGVGVFGFLCSLPLMPLGQVHPAVPFVLGMGMSLMGMVVITRLMIPVKSELSVLNKAEKELRSLALLVKHPLLKDKLELKSLTDELAELLLDTGLSVSKLDKKLSGELSSFERSQVEEEIQLLVAKLSLVKEARVRVDALLVAAQQFQEESTKLPPSESSSFEVLKSIAARLNNVSEETDSFTKASDALKNMKPSQKQMVK